MKVSVPDRELVAHAPIRASNKCAVSLCFTCAGAISVAYEERRRWALQQSPFDLRIDEIDNLALAKTAPFEGAAAGPVMAIATVVTASSMLIADSAFVATLSNLV
jgi:hypothetical protein